MSPFSLERAAHLDAAATHLAHIHLVSIFACGGTVCGEDGCTIAIGVLVNQTDGVVQGVCLQNDQHGPKDLLGVALHLRLKERTTEHFHRLQTSL